ncbi:MAG TPA: DUF4349 domain-containing protein [Mobilitalea sp.]|nr:DUF4349 domain-containing protein [Mobilitalea sp.]
MKRLRTLAVSMLIVVMVFGLVGCASKSMNNKSDRPEMTSGSSDDSKESNWDRDMAYGDTSASEPKMDDIKSELEESYSEDGAEGVIMNSSSLTSAYSGVTSMEKIIRTVSMEVETQDFDEAIEGVNDEIRRLDGYVESANVSGNRYYDTRNMRYSNIIARIPKDRLDEFIGVVYEVSNVVYKSETTKNVTLEYVDTESRKKSLEIEQERLFDLLGKTGTLEEIITLESRLSTIRYELQNYETQLRTYDNQVEYSTVTMKIEEVERLTPKEEEKVTVFSRMKNGLSDTMYSISEGFKDFIVGVTVNLPYIIFWAAIILVCILVINRKHKKNKKNLLPKGASQKDTIDENEDNGQNK